MGIVDRYILTRLTLTFSFFSLVLVGVYWINRAVILFNTYMSSGQSGRLVFELTLLSLPGLMLLVLPIAAFVAALYTTNRLYSDSELVVVEATGFSTFRLARAFLVFGLLVGLLMSVLAHFLVPASVRQLNAREAELAQAISARLLTPGNFESPVRGVTLYVRDIEADGTLRDLMLTDRREEVRETTYTAQRALLVRDPEGPKLIMFDGMAQTLELADQRLSLTSFTDFTVAIGSLMQEPRRGRLDPRGLSTAQLLRAPPGLVEQTRRSVDHLHREAHLRLTQALLSVAATVLGFAALMLGGFSRFGLWRQIAFAVLLVILVKVIDNAAIDLAKRDPQMWPAVYLSSALGGVICLVLLWIDDHPLRRRRRVET